MSVLYCVHFHRIKDGTGRKINQLDCNVLNASDRGGMSITPKGNIPYVTDYHTVNSVNVPVHEPVKRRQCT